MTSSQTFKRILSCITSPAAATSAKKQTASQNNVPTDLSINFLTVMKFEWLSSVEMHVRQRSDPSVRRPLHQRQDLVQPDAVEAVLQYFQLTGQASQRACWQEIGFPEKYTWHWFTNSRLERQVITPSLAPFDHRRWKRIRDGERGLVLLLGARAACAGKRKEGIFLIGLWKNVFLESLPLLVMKSKKNTDEMLHSTAEYSDGEMREWVLRLRCSLLFPALLVQTWNMHTSCSRRRNSANYFFFFNFTYSCLFVFVRGCINTSRRREVESVKCDFPSSPRPNRHLCEQYSRHLLLSLHVRCRIPYAGIACNLRLPLLHNKLETRGRKTRNWKIINKSWSLDRNNRRIRAALIFSFPCLTVIDYIHNKQGNGKQAGRWIGRHSI